MCGTISLVVCIGLIIPSEDGPKEKKDVATLINALSIVGDTYKCAETVELVNKLKQLGKDESIAVLRHYLANGGDNDVVLVICRLLYINPKGWHPPIIGEPVPSASKTGVQKFPLYPIALSNDVPFLLVKGYRSGGLPESAVACLKLCEGFSLVEKDYSLLDHEKAARALIEMESFRQLYEEKDRRDMNEMILRQSKTTNAKEKE